MSLLSHLKNAFSNSTPRLNLPESWTPPMNVAGIVNHWTAGSHVASSLDKEHYHFLAEGDGKVVQGHFKVTDNVPPLMSGEYAAHTRAANSNRIGVAACAMHDATDWPLKFGKYPISKKQWRALVYLNAELAIRYGIPVTPRTILMHGEVEANLGIWQRSKWDIGALKFWSKSEVDCAALGAKLRSEVREVIGSM